MSILDGSKQFLIAADDRYGATAVIMFVIIYIYIYIYIYRCLSLLYSDQPHSAFIPFSITLGRMIISLHDCLISVVGRVSGSTLAPTLKVYLMLLLQQDVFRLKHDQLVVFL